MTKIKETPGLTQTLVISRYSLQLNGGLSGSPPANSTIPRNLLALIYLDGTWQGETAPVTDAFCIMFYPTGSIINTPAYSTVDPEQINVEMDICQLPGFLGLLQNIPNCAAAFTEASVPGEASQAEFVTI
jgi:hypothetical protein